MEIVAEGPSRVGLREFVPILHRWIQRGVVEGPLVDVVDYSHVGCRPRVLLVAFDANYSLDLADGLLSFGWCRKRPNGLSLEETLIRGAKMLVALCAELEAEPELRDRVRFAGDVVRVVSNDRLLAPNRESTERLWRPSLQGLARSLWGECEVEIEAECADPRERFSVVLRSRERSTAAVGG